MKKLIDKQLKQKFFDKWMDSFMDNDYPLLDGMAEYFASQVKKAVNQALDEVRVGEVMDMQETHNKRIAYQVPDTEKTKGWNACVDQLTF